jgi:hypothetical protein
MDRRVSEGVQTPPPRQEPQEEEEELGYGGTRVTRFLYYMSAILTIKSEMDGQKQLGRWAEPKLVHVYLRLMFSFSI